MPFEREKADPSEFEGDVELVQRVLERLALNPRDFAVNKRTSEVEFTFRNRPMRILPGEKFQVDIWTSPYTKAGNPHQGDFPEIGTVWIDRGDLDELEMLFKRFLQRA